MEADEGGIPMSPKDGSAEPVDQETPLREVTEKYGQEAAGILANDGLHAFLKFQRAAEIQREQREQAAAEHGRRAQPEQQAATRPLALEMLGSRADRPAANPTAPYGPETTAQARVRYDPTGTGVRSTRAPDPVPPRQLQRWGERSITGGRGGSSARR
jgi:hypothetical protein